MSYCRVKAALFKHWEDLRSSYWFVPSLMALGAIALSVAAVAVDRQFSIDETGRFAWLYINRPDGARAVLATIAGSAITVGGVVFSITIAAVAYTTSQFGPRLLTNFMRDRGNQVTLGTFIATFLYCSFSVSCAAPVRSPATSRCSRRASYRMSPFSSPWPWRSPAWSC